MAKLSDTANLLPAKRSGHGDFVQKKSLAKIGRSLRRWLRVLGSSVSCGSGPGIVFREKLPAEFLTSF